MLLGVALRVGAVVCFWVYGVDLLNCFVGGCSFVAVLVGLLVCAFASVGFWWVGGCVGM